MTIERPEFEFISEIETVLRDLEDSQTAVTELNNRLNELMASLGERLESIDDRIKAATWIYWMVPEVKAASIAAGLGLRSVRELWPAISEVTAGVACDRCSDPIVFVTRTALKTANSQVRISQEFRVLCEECRSEVLASRAVGYRREAEARADRLVELKEMPYELYLQTREWQDRRKQHLKSAGYRCQVCNSSGVVLDVHHRTYERRGNESYKDLIVLCRGCHDAFHRHALAELPR